MMHTELAGVTALGAGEMASVAGGIDWGRVLSYVYGEFDSFVDGIRAGYAAAG